MHTMQCMHVLPRHDDDGACWRGRTPVVRKNMNECRQSELPSSTWLAKNAPNAQQKRSKDAAKTLQRRRKGVARAPPKAPQKCSKGAAKGAPLSKPLPS